MCTFSIQFIPIDTAVDPTSVTRRRYYEVALLLFVHCVQQPLPLSINADPAAELSALVDSGSGRGNDVRSSIAQGGKT